MMNGVSERAMDSFARAYTLGIKPDYKNQDEGQRCRGLQGPLRAHGPCHCRSGHRECDGQALCKSGDAGSSISDPEPVKKRRRALDQASVRRTALASVL